MLNVLIVDDDQLIRAVLKSFLQEGGYKVVGEAANGEDGYQLAVRLRPNIVCLDVSMPNGNGLMVLKKILEKLPDTIVVMITSDHTSSTVLEAVNNGAKGFVIKPFKKEAVLETMHNTVLRNASPLSN